MFFKVKSNFTVYFNVFVVVPNFYFPFQMGKFYEMFEMDAHIGAQELGLQYMKV